MYWNGHKRQNFRARVPNGPNPLLLRARSMCQGCSASPRPIGSWWWPSDADPTWSTGAMPHCWRRTKSPAPSAPETGLRWFFGWEKWIKNGQNGSKPTISKIKPPKYGGKNAELCSKNWQSCRSICTPILTHIRRTFLTDVMPAAPGNRKLMRPTYVRMLA